MVKVLLALTSHHDVFYDDGAKTGVFFDEAFHPWKSFTDNNADITFVSETGTFGWDDHSLESPFDEAKEIHAKGDHPFLTAVKGIKKASEVNPDEFDIFFAAGGHGAIFDFPDAKDLHKLLLAIHNKGGVIGAVCHGPVIFEKIKASNGEFLIKGKNVTGFTDVGETQVNVDHIMKAQGLKTPRECAVAAGANYIEPKDPWGSFTVVDGKLVTGVNPASASETSEKSLAALA